MSNKLHPSVKARLFAEMRTLIQSHEVSGIIFDAEDDYINQLLARLNVLERDEEYQRLEDTNLQLDDEMFQDVG